MLNNSFIYLKKIFNVIVANFVNFVCSILITLILPKFITVNDYGEWQYFLLLFSYIEFFYLGLPQGIYLRFGGCNVLNLSLRLLRNQILILFFVELLIIAIILKYNLHIEHIIKIFLFIIPIMLWKYFYDYFFQAIGKTNEYAKVLMFDKMLFVLFLFISFWGAYFYNIEYSSITVIYSFLTAKILSIIYASKIFSLLMSYTNSANSTYNIFKEFIININIGYKLMLATFCSIFIIGIVRFFIVNSLGNVYYGRIAIVLSICSFAMIFINAISVVLFPNLRKQINNGYKNFTNHYIAFYKLFNSFLIVLLASVYPLELLFNFWLPKYETSTIFLFILMPVIIFDSNWALFGSTIFKVFRKENIIFKITFTSMMISISLSSVVWKYFNELIFYSLLILFVLCFRFILTEYYILKNFQINLFNFSFSILLFVGIFLFGNLVCSKFWAIILYFSLLSIFFSIYLKELKEAYNILRSIK